VSRGSQACEAWLWCLGLEGLTQGPTAQSAMTSGRDIAPVCPVCTELLGSYGGPVTLPCGELSDQAVGKW
jgi:hypothetical protein